jgi:hypothetical protein
MTGSFPFCEVLNMHEEVLEAQIHCAERRLPPERLHDEFDSVRAEGTSA